MGTRGFVGLIVGSKVLTAYNHYDSYPTYLGAEVARFVRDADDADVAEKFAALKLVDENSKPTPEDIAILAGLDITAQNVGDGGDWYAALRDLQGDLQGYLDAGYFPNTKGLISGGMGSEWGYIADFDNSMLSVYVCRWNEKPRISHMVPFGNLRAEDFDIEAWAERTEEEAYASA